MTDTARALFYVAPGVAEIRTVALPPMEDGLIGVRTLCSGLSRGTERLVFQGRVPESEVERMRAPFQEGDFPFPVKYGYATVGMIEEGPASLLGQRVFTLFPHQTYFRVPLSAAVPVPDRVPSDRATLAANMETALNALWDAPVVPGSRILVLGVGIVGFLLTTRLSRRSDLAVFVSDVLVQRNNLLSDVHVTFRPPDALPGGFEKVFHTSASAAGLATALQQCAFEGEVIELSWYGAEPVAVQLGAEFHANRLTLRASQVGHIAPVKRATTTHRDRLTQALAALEDPVAARAITTRLSFEDLPKALPDLLAPGADGIATCVDYS